MDVEKLALDSSESTLPAKFAKEGLTFDDVLLVPPSRPSCRTRSRLRRG